MSDEFHGDETLLTSHETPSFSLLAMSAKVMIFNVMKLPLRLAYNCLNSYFQLILVCATIHCFFMLSVDFYVPNLGMWYVYVVFFFERRVHPAYTKSTIFRIQVTPNTLTGEVGRPV